LQEAYLLRNHSDVLVLIYEDMIEDLSSYLPRIARFMGINSPLNNELVNQVLEASSKTAMVRDISKYSDIWLPIRMKEVGRNKGGWNIKVAAKVVKNKKNYAPVTPELRAQVEKDFVKKMEEVFVGRFTGYRDLQKAVRVAYK